MNNGITRREFVASAGASLALLSLSGETQGISKQDKQNPAMSTNVQVVVSKIVNIIQKRYHDRPQVAAETSREIQRIGVQNPNVEPFVLKAQEQSYTDDMRTAAEDLPPDFDVVLQKAERARYSKNVA